MSENQQTVYEMIGGEATFRRLVDCFYARVEADEVLRAIFPEDLAPGKEYQYLFLMQYWGGIPTRRQDQIELSSGFQRRPGRQTFIRPGP